MRKYNINVNGTLYEVEVEEIGGAPVQAAPVQAAPVQAAPTQAAPASAPAGATVVSAPMPGNIIDIKVSVGATVAEGDVLCILEAMKMENEIMAPKAGTVTAVNTSKGSSVNTGDALVSIN